jgi:general nucleoside transport system permease protein
MTDTMQSASPVFAPEAAAPSEILIRLRRGSEFFFIPLLSLTISAFLFSIFLLLVGKSPEVFFELVWRGGFGTSFSFQNTLQRAAPLILTALAVAIPARIGLILIGGEGALVLGGFCAAAIAIPMIGTVPPILTLIVMAIVAVIAASLLVGLAGYLRYYRGVNETISSLLLSYIAIATMNFFVEGALRDPGSANKPSTPSIGPDYMVGKMFGSEVHWGLAAGAVVAILLYFLMARTNFGFAARVTGGNPRAALAQGLPVGKLMVLCCMIAGGCAGLAGFFEVGANLGRANASLAAGYGFTGILVSFLARHNPIAVVPVAILFAGIGAAGGLIQRRMGLPDATVLVLNAFVFVVLLTSETLYGRFSIFSGKKGIDRT